MTRNEFYDNLKQYKSLQHYGIVGQKWGQRRWQNYDGTFNSEGKIRYFNKSNKKELNKKLYAENEKYAKIVNDNEVKNALQDYLNTINDRHKEEQRVYSEEFRKNNPSAQNFDGDGTEFWYEFADPDIVKNSDESYLKLRKAISSKCYKNNEFDHEMYNKVLSDINEAIRMEKDPNKFYDTFEKNTGMDFRKNDQQIGSKGDGINEYKTNRKETYYNNRSEEDRRARNWELIKAGIKTAMTAAGYYAAENGLVPSAILMGFDPIVIPIVGGVLIAKNLLKAGFNHIDAKYCEKKANEYYDMLKDNKTSESIPIDTQDIVSDFIEENQNG